MTTNRRTLVQIPLVGLMTVVLCVVATPCVTGALARYRVVDITEIGFTPNIELTGSAGINNKGQAVYLRQVFDEKKGYYVPRAWVWLPEDDYPSVAAGLNYLGSGSGNGMAFDINESGVVVGVDGDCDGCGQAVAWELAVTGAPYTPLGTLPNGKLELSACDQR